MTIKENKMFLIKSNQSCQNTNGNELVLYSYHHCFHSQKVIMALFEKNIPFNNRVVDVTKDEQYKAQFLVMNPTGTLPVLKDGIKFIPNSKAILGYLEDNFSNGEYPRLIPINQGPEIKQKVLSYYDKICKISPYALTMGTIINNRWCINHLRYPYVLSCVRKSLKASLFSSSKTIRKYASKNEELENVLLQIADVEEKKVEFVTNKENYIKLIEAIEDLLGEIEKEFYERGSDKSDWWLCCDQFTIADIALSVLLERLSRLGMELNFWKGGMRPHVEIYYQRVQQRESFKNTMPTPMTDLHFILNTRGPIILGVSLVAAFGILLGGFIYLKK